MGVDLMDSKSFELNSTSLVSSSGSNSRVDSVDTTRAGHDVANTNDQASAEGSFPFGALISSALFLGTSAVRLGYTLLLRRLAANRVHVRQVREVFDIVLSPRTIAVIRATAPKISRHVNEIANKFYSSFFTRYPEMKSLFSLSHGTVIEEALMDPATRLRGRTAGCPVIGVFNGRKSVSGSQVRAMANTIMSFALHVDTRDGHIDFESLVARIVHKHVSHNITPDMYPLLGECLLQAIFSVLGDVASGDVVRAWRDAYWWLAEKLIFEETKLLSNQVANNHGWEGFRSFVVRKHIESESICSVYLFPVDGALPLPEFAAGQYVTLRLRLLDGFITHRNYSLSDCGKKHYFRISVKRLPGGEASCFIHDSLRSGDIIDVSIPSGTFTLHKYLKTPRAERGPIVFICAGIGMTPLLSMMYSLYNESSLGYQGDGPHHNTTSIDSKNSNESLEAASVNTQKEIDLSPHSVGTQTKVFVDNDFLPRSESPVLFLHAAKNKRHDCLVEELFSFAATHPNCRVYKVYSLPRPNVDVFGKDYHYAGHIDAHLLRYLLGDAVTRCTFYLCGPDRFMEAQFTNIVNVGGNQDNIYYERFAAGSGTLLRN